MLNFIRMDLYRFWKTRAAKLILIICFVMVFLTIGAIRLEQAIFSSDLIPDMSEMLEQTFSAEGMGTVDDGLGGITSVGMSINPSMSMILNPSLEIQFSELWDLIVPSGVMLIFVVVFAVIYTYEERRNGYVKNLVGRKFFRSKLFLSKIVICAIYTVIVFLIGFGATALSGLLLLPNPISFEMTGAFFASLGCQLLAHFAFTVFIVMLVAVFDNMVIPLVLGCAYSFNFVSLLYNLFDKLWYKLFEKNISLASYLPSGQISLVVTGASDSVLVKSIIVSLISIIVYGLITVFAAEKRDVR